MTDHQEKKQRAAEWFRQLRDEICASYEAIEDEAKLLTSRPAGRFERKVWPQVEGAGGGEMSVMRGRVFEKVGVNISVVQGVFSDQFRREIPAIDENPSFWAAGISLVAHMQSPLVPAAHMNTRMLITGDGLGYNMGGKPKMWFGGGADLTPTYPDDQDTAQFHEALEECCDRYDQEYYTQYKKWCDEYFMIQHRKEPRGVGGIFFDYLQSGNWESDFSFTRAVGETFRDTYPQIVRRHMNRRWTKAQREHQLVRRGRYVEFNLLYDRGTRFGLMTGGNTEAIFMSLPPEAKWP